MSLMDIQRPLNKRGKRDAPVMAEKMYDRVKDIEYAAISPAKRARRTAEAFTDIYDLKSIDIVDKIYHASERTLMEVIHELPIEYSSAMVFGHNPGFTFLHNEFAAQGIDNLPTCGIFELVSTALSWADIDSTNTEVGFLIYPKMFL